MDHDSLVFRCPSCGVKLAVLAQRAGVSGPCPACGGTIQSPLVAGLPLTAGQPLVSLHPSSPALAPGAVPMPGVASQPPVPTATANPPLDRPEAKPLPSTTILQASSPAPQIGAMWNADPPTATVTTPPRRRDHPWRWPSAMLVLLALALAAAYYLTKP